jgi:hypothetical protein
VGGHNRAMLVPVLAAQQLTTPTWTWVFFGLVLLAVVLLMGFALRKFGGSRSAQRSRRSGRGLTAEQLAFQEEMRLMLQLRMQARSKAVAQAPEPPAEDGASAREPGAGPAPANM